LGASVTFFISDLLEQNGAYDILLANLPYVPEGFHINAAASYEPPQALFSGPDGLVLYRKLFLQIEKSNIKPHAILTESFPFQHGQLTTMAEAVGFTLTRTDDFIQLFELA